MNRTDLYLDDMVIGEQFVSGSCTLNTFEIVEFAQRYDPQSFHLDPIAAKAGPFGGLVASGLQTLAVSYGLLYGLGFLGTANRGGLALEDLRWLRPVKPGDAIHTVATIRDVVPSRSQANRGVLKIGMEVLNQQGELVMTAVLVCLVVRQRGA